MKKRYSLLCVLIIILKTITFAGNPGKADITTAQFKTEKANAYLVEQCYEQLKAQLPWGSSFSMLANIASDDAFAGGQSGSDIQSFHDLDEFIMDANNDALKAQWKKSYEGIRRSNFLLDFSKEGSDASMDRYRAEAKFLRAFHYFNLVRAFGRIPIILTSDIKIKHNFIQSNTADVYTQIESDLLASIDKLPYKSALSSTEHARATKGAAQSLLGKVYVYEQKWNEAAAILDQVIFSGEYALLAKFSDVFKVDNKFNQESIFEIFFTDEYSVDWTNITTGNINVAMMGMTGPTATYNSGWGFCPIAPGLVNQFKTQNDKVRWVGTIISADTLAKNNITFMPRYENTGYFNNKYPALKANTNDEQQMMYRQDEIILRYADVLLLAAEAQFYTGNIATSSNYLNTVRSRAQLFSLIPQGTALLTAIQNERQLELAMEGNRYFDLVRWGLANQVLQPLGFKQATNGLWPIPQLELQKNSSLMQNPGYDAVSIGALDTDASIYNFLSKNDLYKYSIDSIIDINYNDHQTDSLLNGVQPFKLTKDLRIVNSSLNISNWNTLLQEKKTKAVDTLDNSGNIVANETYSYNFENANYNPITYNTNTYDANGLLKTSNTSSSYSNESFYQTQHNMHWVDEIGRDTLITVQTCSNGNCLETQSSRFVNTYDAGKRIKSTVFYTVSADKLSSTTIKKEVYLYDNTKKTSTTLVYLLSDNVWKLSAGSKDSLVYNSENKLIEDIYSTFNADSIEAIDHKSTYIYDKYYRIKTLGYYKWITYLDCWYLQNRNFYTYATCQPPVTPIISQQGNSLVSNAETGNQWYNASGIIENAIQKTYNPTTTNDYHVIVTLNYCESAASNTISFTPTTIPNTSESKFLLYPVPVRTVLNIEDADNIDSYEIYATSGAIVLKSDGLNSKKIQIAMIALNPGLYTIHIGYSDKSKTSINKKFIKQ